VPDLPSAADLDLAGWGLAANADRVVTPDDEIKVIGPLRLEIPVFNAFLNDADEASRRLSMVLAEWADAAVLPVPSEAAVQAFALAQGAERVGHESLAALSRQLVRVLRACSALPGPAAVAAAPGRAAQHLTAAAEEMRRVLHQFAAGFMTEPSAVVLARLDDCLADPTPEALPDTVSPAPEGELQSLHDLAALQADIAQALDRLATGQPSDAAFADAAARVKDAQRLLETVLGQTGGRPQG
jgi:chemosensory pili system protein ChpA (sensor histidine kinase/response regulator)